MTLVEERSCFMIGMPSSGKTTYLVSLTSMLMFGEHKTALNLQSYDLPEGLNNIQNEIANFNKFQPVGRTIGTAEGWIEIPLCDERGNKICLRIPDLSGEIFRDLVHERVLKKEIALHLREADILLFFLNIETISKELRIPLGEESAMELIEKDYNQPVIEQGKAQLAKSEPQEEKPVTQTDLVELLQCVLHLSKKRVKVKFIISAWDSMEKQLPPDKPVPEDCMAKFLPLFLQFLRSNPERVDTEIWGVSAQGFDFSDQEEREKRIQDDCRSYARLITPDGEETHDLTRLLVLN